MSWNLVEMGSFLKERKGRYKPDDPIISDLKRIDKIDFFGSIHTSEKPSKTNMILVKDGDLVISGINVAKGAMAVYHGNEDVKATIHYSSYEYDESKIDIQFLKHFLRSIEFKEALREQVPGGIKTEIKPKHILPLKVFIPEEIEEQEKIVSHLDSQNSKIEAQSSKLTHQLNMVKQLHQAFLREAMQGKLVPQVPNEEPASVLLEKIKAEKERLIKEKKIKKQKPLPPITKEEIPFEIPETWVWCRLGEIIDLISGQHISAKDYNKKEIGDPYLTGPSDFGTAHPIPTRWTEKPKVVAIKDDILITVKGAGVGKTNLNNLNKVAIGRQLMAVRPLGCKLKYIHFFLLNLFQLLQEEKKGTGIPGISRENITEKIFQLPPLPEQQRIVAKLDALMKLCDELEASIKESQAQNELLLQQVLREALEPKEKKVVP